MMMREERLLNEIDTSLVSLRKVPSSIMVNLIGEVDNDVRDCVHRMVQRDDRLSSIKTVYDCWNGIVRPQGKTDDAYIVYLPRTDRGFYKWEMGNMVCKRTRIALTPYFGLSSEGYRCLPLMVPDDNICASAFLMYKPVLSESEKIVGLCNCSNRLCGYDPKWNKVRVDIQTMHAAYNAVCEERGMKNIEVGVSVFAKRYDVYSVIMRATLMTSEKGLYEKMVQKIRVGLRSNCSFPVPTNCLMLEGTQYEKCEDEDVFRLYAIEPNGNLKVAIGKITEPYVSPVEKSVIEGNVPQESTGSMVNKENEKLVKMRAQPLVFSIEDEERCRNCKFSFDRCKCTDPCGDMKLMGERIDRDCVTKPILQLMWKMKMCTNDGSPWEFNIDMCGVDFTAAITFELNILEKKFCSRRLDLRLEGTEIGQITTSTIYADTIALAAQCYDPALPRLRAMRDPDSILLPKDRLFVRIIGLGDKIVNRMEYIRLTSDMSRMYYRQIVRTSVCEMFKFITKLVRFRGLVTPHLWYDAKSLSQVVTGFGYVNPAIRNTDPRTVKSGCAEPPRKKRKI